MGRGCTLLLALLTACAAPREARPVAGGAPPESEAGTPLEVLDLYGRRVRPLESEGRPVVVLFVATECPISNRYAPEVGRLVDDFGAEADFWVVYPDPDDDVADVRAHALAHAYRARVARDPVHSLVGRARASVTPEAAVFDADGELVYTGRIDDRWVDFGQVRAQATVHDLERILLAVLAGEEVGPIRTPAVGCPIPPLLPP